MTEHRKSKSLRHRILAFVGAFIVLSLLGSTLSLYRITEVNRSLDAINRVSVPLGRLLAQLESDAEVFRRELDRRLGSSYWNDPHWKPRPLPRWIEDVIESELERAGQLIRRDAPWAAPPQRAQWEAWARSLTEGFRSLRDQAAQLYRALERKDQDAALRIHPVWIAAQDEWARQLHWGVTEHEQLLRQTFAGAEQTVVDLRTGLEIILVVVVSLSLFLLWLGERALRPLGELTRLAREITRRGLRREDKAILPELALSRDDEVSQLSREFHRMATSLLEREKTVEAQNARLHEQNRQLREMGEMRERLRVAENLAAVGRMSAQVAHEVRNPLHAIGLEAEVAVEAAQKLGNPALKQSLQSILGAVDRLEKITENYLKLSRLSAGERRCFDIGDALESVLATYAPACEAQGVQVDWAREGDAPLLIRADRDLFEQVLGNLLRNALQALEEGRIQSPRIAWRLGAAESGRVWLRIEDNGPGIPAEAREKLFTPFFTTRAQGTGLGLSFIQKVLEDHGGKIHCVERSPGQGACFEITLPALDREIEAERKVLHPDVHA